MKYKPIYHTGCDFTHITAIIHEFIILSLIVLDECHVLEPLFYGDVDHKVGTLPPCNSIPSGVHAQDGHATVIAVM